MYRWSPLYPLLNIATHTYVQVILGTRTLSKTSPHLQGSMNFSHRQWLNISHAITILPIVSLTHLHHISHHANASLIAGKQPDCNYVQGFCCFLNFVKDLLPLMSAMHETQSYRCAITKRLCMTYNLDVSHEKQSYRYAVTKCMSFNLDVKIFRCHLSKATRWVHNRHCMGS